MSDSRKKVDSRRPTGHVLQYYKLDSSSDQVPPLIWSLSELEKICPVGWHEWISPQVLDITLAPFTHISILYHYCSVAAQVKVRSQTHTFFQGKTNEDFAFKGLKLFQCLNYPFYSDNLRFYHRRIAQYMFHNFCKIVGTYTLFSSKFWEFRKSKSQMHYVVVLFKTKQY